MDPQMDPRELSCRWSCLLWYGACERVDPPCKTLVREAERMVRVRGGTAYGRDHNPNAMTIWMAGGGCNAGHTVGATDEIGMTAVEDVHHVRDFHVTLLRLLGLDDNKLTYYHAGRFKQLSQFGGKVSEKLLA